MPFPGNPLSATEVHRIARSVVDRALKRWPSTTPTVLARVATAIAKHESRFYPLAYNGFSGTDEAIGLMQILPGTQKDIERWLGLPHDRERLYEPDYSLLLGATYLAYQRKRYKDWPTAVWAYHSGSYPGKARHRAKATEYRSEFLKNYKALFGSSADADEKNGITDSAPPPITIAPRPTAPGRVVIQQAGISPIATLLILGALAGGWYFSSKLSHSR